MSANFKLVANLPVSLVLPNVFSSDKPNNEAENRKNVAFEGFEIRRLQQKLAKELWLFYSVSKHETAF